MKSNAPILNCSRFTCYNTSRTWDNKAFYWECINKLMLYFSVEVHWQKYSSPVTNFLGTSRTACCFNINKWRRVPLI